MDVLTSSHASPEHLQRLIRSARKLEQVLGTSAFLIDSTGTRPLQILPPSASRHHDLYPHVSFMNAIENAVPARRLRSCAHHTRRQGSIFDLTEEQILALGIDNSDRVRSHTPSKLPTDDLPRPSLDSAVSASTTSDTSSMFAPFISHSASSSRTSINVIMEDCPLSPTTAAPVTPTLMDSTKLAKRRRPDSRPLFLTVEPCLTATKSRRASQGPLTPRTAPLNYSPSAPLTPTTPSEEDFTQLQRRKLQKIVRTLGENVPIDLVLPSGGRKKARRASIAVSSDTADVASCSSPIEFEHYGFGWDDSEMPSASATSERVPASVKFASRQRAASVTRKAAPAHFKVPAPQASDLNVPLPIFAPVFASGPRQPAAERWIGSWNRPNIHTVQNELRALRWR